MMPFGSLYLFGGLPIHEVNFAGAQYHVKINKRLFHHNISDKMCEYQQLRTPLCLGPPFGFMAEH